MVELADERECRPPQRTNQEETRSGRVFFVFADKTPGEVDELDVQRWLERLRDLKLKPATVYARVSFISSFYRWAMRDPTVGTRFAPTCSPVRKLRVPTRQGQSNPYRELLEKWKPRPAGERMSGQQDRVSSVSPPEAFEKSFYSGTTLVQTADAEGWVVSITPSGGWIPAVIAGRTGIGLSQRAQSFVLDAAENPFNVIEPGKLPRVTLTPSLALKDGKPFLSFAVQGGDSQDQNLLQFFLNVVEFGMNVQEATEAPNINSFQMRSSFGAHETRPGRLLLAESMPPWVRAELRRMGYELTFEERTSGPINAVFFDREHGTMWGGSSNHGEDYGIAW